LKILNCFLQSGKLRRGISTGSVANIQTFINGTVQPDYPAFFNADGQQKHQ